MFTTKASARTQIPALESISSLQSLPIAHTILVYAILAHAILTHTILAQPLFYLFIYFFFFFQSQFRR